MSAAVLHSSTMQHSTSVPKTGLIDLPVELLDQIILYCVDTQPMTICLAPTSASLTRSLFPFVSRRKRYTVTNYPYALLLTNRLISNLAFKHIWSHKSLVINLTAADALCFLLHGLSLQQRDALRRLQMPRFLLSWSFPVNEDIWLIAGKEKTASWYEGAKDPEKEVKGKRFLALTGMLGKRVACVCRPWKMNMGLIQA